MSNHRPRMLSAFLVALSVFSLMPARAQVTVFSNTASTPRRIPSIVRLNDGKLLAISDYRPVNGDQDIGGKITENGKSRTINISIDGCLSEDNGNSWGSYYRLLTGNVNATDFRYAFGDAATVVDRESGKIMMMNAAGKYGFFDSNKQYVARSYSSDNGKTWTSSDASSSFYTNDTYVKHLFFSSGRMIQSTRVKTGDYYRIYAAVNTRVLASYYAQNNGGSRVVYSDDFGQTWHYLGGISIMPAPYGDECKVEELPNGDVLLSCRANGYASQTGSSESTSLYGYAGRWFNVYSFSDIEKGTGSWGTVARSGRYESYAADVETDGQTYGSSTNGEILLVPAVGKDGQPTFVLLQSIPYAGGNTRINGTIYWRELEYKDTYSPDEFVTGWRKYSVNKDSTAFAYSTMVLDKKGDVAFIYEANRPTSGSYGGYDIVFESLSLETITNGAYSYYEGPVEGFYTTSDPAWKPNTSAVRILPPTFSPVAGTYRCDQTVELKAEDGMTIRYTLDGSVPTTQSTLYTAPLTISTTTTVNAIAVNANGNSSAVATAKYIIDKTVAVPQFSVSEGTYDSEQPVALTATGTGTKIYYTLDGSDPTTLSTLYTAPLTIGTTTTVKAIAVDEYGNQSGIAEAKYVINKTVSAPTFSVSAGTYASAQTVALTAKGEDVKIYYTLDGSDPTTLSTLYTVPLTISGITTLKAIAIDKYGNKSGVASAAYTISPVDKEAEKYGTTISLDDDCTHQLFSNGASNASMDKQFFSYLRHDIAHVQLISATDPQLSSDGARTFAKKSNNMLFNEVEVDGKNKKCLTLYRGVSKYSPFKKTPYCYAAVVAPKGYRIIRYQMDIFAEHSKDGAVVSQYVYDGSKADGINVVDSVVVKNGMDVWDKTLNGTNVLYFRINCNDTLAAHSVMLKSLKLTYAIDQPFDAVVPGVEGSLDVHTGLLDLGTFSSNKDTHSDANGGAGYWSFDDSRAITDGQTVNIVNGDGSKPEIVTVNDDTYFVAAVNGDYYVEAPQKFRIVGATLNFLRSEATGGREYVLGSSVTSSSVPVDTEFVITDGNGNYLNRDETSIVNGTDLATATRWTVVRNSSNSSKYELKDGDYYLAVNNSTSMKAATNETNGWTWNTSRHCFTASTSKYYIAYQNGSWTFLKTVSNSSSTSQLATVTVSSTKKFTASNFTAAVYDRKGAATPSENTRKLTSTNSAERVELTDFNNDAVRFSISGLTGTNAAALYNVSLQLLPLNPEVQTLKVSSEVDGNVVGTSEVTSLNYVFNNGNAVNVLVPREADTNAAYPIVFREAHNEEKTMWYDNGQNENRDTQGGYSNYYLIHSDADGTNGLDKDATPYAAVRVTSKKVSTAKLIATNIEEVAAGTASELKDNVFDKSKTEPKELSLTDGAQQTVYVYSADEPTFQIMPSGKGSKHIDYRYYTITVKPMVVKETPVVTITPVYTSTLKGANHKTDGAVASDGGTADTQHTFVGVTISSKAQTAGQTPAGVLSNKEIIAAVREELAKYNNYCGFGSADPYRGILYIDMSGLTTVSVESENGVNPWDAFHKGTADNCLYFMPEGFRRNVENTIAKTDGGYEAVGDIVVSDQQPFFSPYSFKTGTRRAKYDREGTATTGGNIKAEVQNMAVVLPFSVPLDGEGNLRVASHAADNSVTFHDITGYGEVTSVLAGSGTDLTYAMVAEAVRGGEARANQPYYVTSTTPGFTFSIPGATFVATPEEGELTRTSTSADGKMSWTARGTYSGVQPAKDKNLWYFSKDFFWKSGQLVSSNHVNIRPFRACFESSSEVPGAKAGVVFSHDEIVSTGISDALAPVQPLTIMGGRGFLAVTSAAAATVCVRTVSGQVVAAPTAVEAGQTWRISVPQGVYLVNNLKVVVR